ncbi:hypothetical protein LSM04_007148 [Trypanosoma melophagium]|uniref:uncharacterized protein n=1 Tax=Trypanosoma melophagium TaxID=715481 RepID=UPI00351A5106|nr:hypothetical protein LSM04_007148 [Trypanosoma melophagium]
MEEIEETTTQRESASKSRKFPSDLFCRALLLICVSAVLLFYSIAITLGMVSVISDSYIQIKNLKNVEYKYTAGETSSETSILMIPEYSIDVGMLYFTIGPSYFSRKRWNLLPLQPLPNAAETVDPLLSETIRNSFVKVRRDALQLGFASSESCGGTSADTIMGRSYFVVASISIAIVCSACAVAVGAYFFVSLTQPLAQFGGHVSGCWGRKAVELYGDERELVITVRVLQEKHQKERILITGMSICGVLGTFFFMFAFAIMQRMFSSTLKCGRSFCTTYNIAMKELFELLYSRGGGGEGGYGTSCDVGSSFRTLLTGTVMASVGVVFLFLILGVHVFLPCSKFKVVKLYMGRGEPSGESDVRNPMRSAVQSPDASDSRRYLMETYSWMESVPSYIEIPRSTESPRSRECREDSSKSTYGGLRETEELKRECRAIQIRQQEFIANVEVDKRLNIYSEEELEFRAGFRWIKRKIWYGEFLRGLHLQSLNLYFAPLLNLHAEETFCRQFLWLKNCNKARKKLRELERNSGYCHRFQKYINSVISRIEVAKEEGLRLASHYKVDDGIYKYNVLTNRWLQAADIFPTEMEKSDKILNNSDAQKHSELLYSPVLVDVSSSESLEDQGVKLLPLCGLVNVPFIPEMPSPDEYLLQKYTELVKSLGIQLV